MLEISIIIRNRRMGLIGWIDKAKRKDRNIEMESLLVRWICKVS